MRKERRQRQRTAERRCTSQGASEGSLGPGNVVSVTAQLCRQLYPVPQVPIIIECPSPTRTACPSTPATTPQANIREQAPAHTRPAPWLLDCLPAPCPGRRRLSAPPPPSLPELACPPVNLALCAHCRP